LADEIRRSSDLNATEQPDPPVSVDNNDHQVIVYFQENNSVLQNDTGSLRINLVACVVAYRQMRHIRYSECASLDL
jgi:hypothetical protein